MEARKRKREEESVADALPSEVDAAGRDEKRVKLEDGSPAASAFLREVSAVHAPSAPGAPMSEVPLMDDAAAQLMCEESDLASCGPQLDRMVQETERRPDPLAPTASVPAASPVESVEHAVERQQEKAVLDETLRLIELVKTRIAADIEHMHKHHTTGQQPQQPQREDESVSASLLPISTLPQQLAVPMLQ